MWLNKRHFIHIVDISTLHQNAIFIKQRTSRNPWADFLEWSGSLYIGFFKLLDYTVNQDLYPTILEHMQKIWEFRYNSVDLSPITLSVKANDIINP